jgi:hypothetical protein
VCEKLRLSRCVEEGDKLKVQDQSVMDRDEVIPPALVDSDV